uniref:Class II, major histocompatibility complex, transactivator n=1 Tax=Xiphophorus couchianus TaxID=32473 RepID=A0A3B5MIB0_9TELE
AVAPFLMSSFQPGSMSDTASKVTSPTAAPPSPTNGKFECVSQTTVHAVRDYIQQSKIHMSQTCQYMEAGLSLNAHYVNVSVSRREIARSGKNTNRCLDKELIITGDIDRQKSSMGQSQVSIFDSLNGKRYNVLFGNAGMGKTTVIKKLCLDWSRDCIPQFDFVFLLDGKQLALTEPVHSLQTLLLSQSSFAPHCADPEGVYAQILAAPKRVLIVFDGFDELRHYEILLQTQKKELVASLQKDSKAQAFTVKQLFSSILQRVLLPGCTLLLATRPRGTASQLLRRADSFLEVCGFTPANVETYVSQYFSDPELRESALDSLKSSSYLNLLCWNPGLCHLVCTALEQCKSEDALPRTLTALCHKVLCLKMEKDRGKLLSQLCSIAWEGVKSNSSALVIKMKNLLPTGLNYYFCLLIFLLLSVLFLHFPHPVQCLSLPRTVTDHSFLQTLPFQMGAKGRRKPQREELELTQRIAAGLLFHNRTELQSLHSYSEAVFRDMVASKQALVMKHLEGLCFGDLNSTQILEACNYVYEASFTHQESGKDTSAKMLTRLALNLPELLTFRGVPLNPPDVFTVQNALRMGGAEGRSFCLDLEDTGIQICGLRSLVALNNINTYRACIADVVTLWEELEKRSDEGLLQGAVSKFKIHPLKATQVCHMEHLERLVSIHTSKRLSDSVCLIDWVPAVKELYKLEFELGLENSPLALPKLWDLLPGLHNLQHLDMENSKIGDKGAEKLANALVSLRSLEVLNLSENCIGDQGVKKLALALKDLPKLHCLSLYSNVISDEGAESLAAVLPHMASLTDLDIKYNKMTDIGAQSLGASLRKCSKVKTLRMWNQCIPYGVFERLKQQDSRILWQ